MAQNPPPPPPFHDFDFSFDLSPSHSLPAPPPLPSSAGLFSPSETTDLLGFLDNFSWELDADIFAPLTNHDPNPNPPVPPQPFTPAPLLPPDSHLPPLTTPSLPFTNGSTPTSYQPQPQPPPAPEPTSPTSPGGSTLRNKPLLSSPQKRLNHIMSEQKRRNAIREGYAQLTTLLAPAGAPPGSGMPTRGRPKGSGSRGKGRTKGKSGVLFRAVEYIHWLDEELSALQEEVLRVEALAGVRGGP
ncbi:hypothetical protein OF83DRAFT_1163136 [Amylostereum chailletii]|nr:hypothetical protein OF83DRAFT_1163136 [Amylostereum chailletii]